MSDLTHPPMTLGLVARLLARWRQRHRSCADCGGTGYIGVEDVGGLLLTELCAGCAGSGEHAATWAADRIAALEAQVAHLQEEVRKRDIELDTAWGRLRGGGTR